MTNKFSSNIVFKPWSRIMVGICLALFSNSAMSQTVIEERHGLQITARAQADKIKLRWAPTSMYSWKQSNKSGFVLERFTLRRGANMLPLAERSKGIKLTPAPLKPWIDGEQWLPLMETNEYASIAAQALYGKSFTMTNGENPLVAQKDEQANRFGFGLFAADQSVEVAEALGLYFEDTNVKPGEFYLYKIYPAQQPANGVSIDTGFVYLGADEIYTLPQITEVESEFENQLVYLSWDHGLYDQFYGSYLVERSTDGKNFKEISDKPFVGMDKNGSRQERMLFRDSLTTNDQVYYYRVKGKSIFDEVGPPSEASQGMGVNAKVDHPIITGIVNNENQSLGVSWEFSKENETEITGFQLSRSDNHLGPFTVITENIAIDKSLRYFIDESPLAVNYYKVVAIDKYGRSLPSFAALSQLDDETPPSAPLNARGTIMDDGTMVLSWSANTESDLMGYRVYLANHKDREEYVQITSKAIHQNFMTYEVNMNTISEEVFIKVVALDYRHNASDYSSIATITRPDAIAPAAPIFTAAKASTQAVSIQWENSASRDVAVMELERKKAADDNWTTIRTLKYPDDLAVKIFQDSSAERGVNYQYRLKAIDDAELITFSKVITATRIDNGIRKSVAPKDAVVDRKKKVVVLNWEYEPDAQDLSHFVIYRAAKEGRPGKYDSIKKVSAKLVSNLWKYEDRSLQMDTNYKYQIRAIYANGAKSTLSELITVNY